MSKVIEIPCYPQGFYSFKDGVDISDDEINEWIEECRRELEDEEPGNYAIKASGNASVMVIKYQDEYYYMVSKGYADASEHIEETQETRRITV